MIRARQDSPSISGMLMSSVTTSGCTRASCSSAANPLRAVCTSKSPPSARMPFSARRISAESSTTRTEVATRRGSSRSGGREGLVREDLLERGRLLGGEQLVDLDEQEHALLVGQVGDPGHD